MGGNPFEYLKIQTPASKRRDRFVISCWIVFIVGLVSGCAYVIQSHAATRSANNEMAYRKYLAMHGCKRVGFAGKDAIAVYQCIDGLYLATELKRKAKSIINE